MHIKEVICKNCQNTRHVQSAMINVLKAVSRLDEVIMTLKLISFIVVFDIGIW